MGPSPHIKKPSKLSRVKRRLRFKLSLLPVAVMVAIFLTVAVPVYKLYNKLYYGDDDISAMDGANDPDLLPLYRDLYSQEPWPGVEWNDTEPSQGRHTVHYLWCGQKTFRLQDYLGVLSILRVVQPLHIIFHYTHLPRLDTFWYHTWFHELKQSVPNLELRRLLSDHPCDSVGMLRDALRLLSPKGGIFVGEGILLSKNVDHLKFLPFWFAFADPRNKPTSGVLFVNTGFNEHTLEDYVQTILVNGPVCVSVEEYDQLEVSEDNQAVCVALTEDVYPREFRSSDTPFGELARWLFYGRRRPFATMHSGRVGLIPRVAHYTWMSAREGEGPNQFTFANYLSVLSALHVAELDHVYVHGDVEPSGPWWEELRTQNVTFLRLESPATVFQQTILVPAHASDVVRYSILYKYGGVYQDNDVIWVNKLPDWLLGYPAVACPEWPQYGEWPDGLNLGVLLARRHAPFLRHFLSTYRYFRDGDWNFNAVLMPYRTYEWFPDTLFVDQFLQAICSHGVCHAAWAEDEEDDHDINDDDHHQPNPTDDTSDNNNNNNVLTHQRPRFSLQEVRAVHFRVPKVPDSLRSPGALKGNIDMFADIGRYVLRQADRMDLLDDDDVGSSDGGDLY